ncbi:hypothetical protein D8674_039478 [Pyrus ussuriensis x Pyrus communis]|uniref:Uncharacterized protein n=1 Tax=Pyrus ussuriensis x Pyrus communis TaxID=2448454 RepID=A0A5N5GZY0_9ROSA|nr:hypothetical protein D8674_039478 [Pyrus ussuriensis x Pyrus communis]
MRKGFYFLCQSLQEFSTLLIFLHFVGLRRCGKRPDIKHRSFIKEEDIIICSQKKKGKGYIHSFV